MNNGLTMQWFVNSPLAQLITYLGVGIQAGKELHPVFEDWRNDMDNLIPGMEMLNYKTATQVAEQRVLDDEMSTSTATMMRLTETVDDQNRAVDDISGVTKMLTGIIGGTVTAQGELEQATDDATVAIDENADGMEEAIPTVDRYMNAINGVKNAVQEAYDVLEFFNKGMASGQFRSNLEWALALDIWGAAYGGIVGYDRGGVIGIPRAQAGYITPQTGREVPILAHEYEVVANTSQQRNVAEWFWKFINNPPDISGGSPIEITNLIELDGKVIYKNTDTYLYNSTTSTKRSKGLK